MNLEALHKMHCIFVFLKNHPFKKLTREAFIQAMALYLGYKPETLARHLYRRTKENNTSLDYWMEHLYVWGYDNPKLFKKPIPLELVENDNPPIKLNPNNYIINH